MALDPTFNAYALVVAGASGTVAAGMHATSLAGSGKPWPARRVLISELIRAFVVGVASCEVMRALPVQVQLVPLLVVAAIVGGTLGPRGLGWLLLSGLGVLKRVVPLLDRVPDPPTDPPPKEVSADAQPK